MSRIIEIEIGCCGECPFYNWKKHKCDKGATDCGGARSRFYEDCPLKWREVTKEESKMSEKEYIKREALIKDLTARGTVGDFGIYKIQHFLAADVAPVRHGHWIVIETGFDEISECSLCGYATNKYGLNFCPNCGAKMDKES